MNLRLFYLTLFVIAVIVLMPARAPSAQRETVTLGAGSITCGEWLTEHENTKSSDINTLRKSMMMSWVQGYLVGSADGLTLLTTRGNLKLSEAQAKFQTVSGWAFDPPQPEAIKHWVNKYCREHPLDPIVDGSAALVAELFTKK